ncbi:hypothetical protein LIER_14853 [Lithospermum erythrorhizon]|uniref:BTB domain-containing protein n=1 Tax=Lithospermum erythrorhizon TaxID=34254 RepID=A0AAV3Q0M5_LITER
MEMSDNDRSSSELRALDCNLSALCEHIQIQGFNNGAFSDVIVHAMGSHYSLHRLLLSRSSYFRNMLQGPWREANAPILTLHIDDDNVNGEAIEIALAYLYGHHPKLNDNNAFRVLAAASFLDLQDLCVICTDFIISELWTSNFLGYQMFAESQDYGKHGERVRSACWGYLCQSGAVELKEVLPKLSSQTLLALLTSDELWVPSEEKRFELALYSLLSKDTISDGEHDDQKISSSEMEMNTQHDATNGKGQNMADEGPSKKLEVVLGHGTSKVETSSSDLAHNRSQKYTDDSVDSSAYELNCRENSLDAVCSQSNLGSEYGCNTGQTSSIKPFSCSSEIQNMSSHRVGASTLGGNILPVEGPSQEDAYHQLNNYSWLPGEHGHCVSMSSSRDVLMSNEWGSCSMPSLSWGGRVVCHRDVKASLKGLMRMNKDDHDTFINIFEAGSLLYCNMSFESLLNVRNQLEEMGFPCKAVNDGLWLQMLLSQRVQEIGAYTCPNCRLVNMSCACKSFGYSRGISSNGSYVQDRDRNNPSDDYGNVYIANPSQGEGNGLFRNVRVHVRGANDGLAEVGRGNTFVPSAAWPPTRFVYSRVPIGMGNRNNQQYPGSDDVDNRTEHNVDLAGDGLTALVGLSQGGRVVASGQSEQSEQAYEADLRNRMVGCSITGTSSRGVPVQMLNSQDDTIGGEWENMSNGSISLDMRTPLCHFPPFRFAVQFQDVHRLCDGQVKHSPEVFYAGSLWKVSVQAFCDEDPQGRRTLGLFLHRRKAETNDPVRKVHMYVDSREKVTARYQLICPSKREVVVFGSVKQTGTLLPKAPKGWGWRTALLFDELGDLLQNGALRIAALVQLV